MRPLRVRKEQQLGFNVELKRKKNQKSIGKQNGPYPLLDFQMYLIFNIVLN